MKATSAILLLLLKHLKVNHMYQFEYMGQHLVFANCIPLILKFFNQNVSQYVAARNNFSTLNFPNCVFSPQDAELTNDLGMFVCVRARVCSNPATLGTSQSILIRGVASFRK